MSQPWPPEWQEGTAPLGLATKEAKRLSFFVTFSPPQPGQATLVSERTRSSKSAPQLWHPYSNIGIRASSSNPIAVTAAGSRGAAARYPAFKALLTWSGGSPI
jgi:hypothetical protein